MKMVWGLVCLGREGFKMNVSETIKLIRRAIGLAGTHQDLATIIGVTRQMITRWANGGGMNLEHYIKIKEYVEKYERKTN